tara:strand:- start:367 stop:642 length:276 start_codon:yes stop_codon:yes gene_type:complete
MSKGYEIESKYMFVDSKVVKMYLIGGIPFSFDALEKEEEEDKWILSEAAINPEFTMEQVYKSSDYLIAEELHPLLFDVPVINPELMPDESL